MHEIVVYDFISNTSQLILTSLESLKVAILCIYHKDIFTLHEQI